MKKILFFAILTLFAAGCRNPDIQVVEPWEGHFKTVDEFHERTAAIQLKSGQSIWVLSNGTLYRVLKKVEK